MEKESRLFLEHFLIIFAVFVLVMIVPSVLSTIFPGIPSLFAIRAGLSFFLIGLIARQERYKPLASIYVKTNAIFGFPANEKDALQMIRIGSVVEMAVGMLIITAGLLVDYFDINNPIYIILCVFIILNLIALAFADRLKKVNSFKHLNSKIYRIGFVGGCFANIAFALWAINTIHWK